MKGELNSKKFFNLLAFCSLIIAGVVLVLTKVLGVCGITWKLLGILNTIAYTLAFVVTAVAAYHYVRTKHSVAYTVIYVIAVILVIIPLILNLF